MIEENPRVNNTSYTIRSKPDVKAYLKRSRGKYCAIIPVSTLLHYVFLFRFIFFIILVSIIFFKYCTELNTLIQKYVS